MRIASTITGEGSPRDSDGGTAGPRQKRSSHTPLTPPPSFPCCCCCCGATARPSPMPSNAAATAPRKNGGGSAEFPPQRARKASGAGVARCATSNRGCARARCSIDCSKRTCARVFSGRKRVALGSWVAERAIIQEKMEQRGRKCLAPLAADTRLKVPAGCFCVQRGGWRVRVAAPGGWVQGSARASLIRSLQGRPRVSTSTTRVRSLGGAVGRAGSQRVQRCGYQAVKHVTNARRVGRG